MSLWVKGRLEVYRSTLCISLCWSLYCANTLKNHHNWTVITRMYNSSSASSFLCLFHFISQPVGLLSKLQSFPILIYLCHSLQVIFAMRLGGWRSQTMHKGDLWPILMLQEACIFMLIFLKMVQLPVLSRGYQWHDCSVLRTPYVNLLFS